MWPDLVVFVIGCVVLGAVGYGGYLGGRDAAERRAYATIASLRGDLAARHLEIARLREVTARQARNLASVKHLAPEPPEWMRP